MTSCLLEQRETSCCLVPARPLIPLPPLSNCIFLCLHFALYPGISPKCIDVQLLFIVVFVCMFMLFHFLLTVQPCALFSSCLKRSRNEL